MEEWFDPDGKADPCSRLLRAKICVGTGDLYLLDLTNGSLRPLFIQARDEYYKI